MTLFTTSQEDALQELVNIGVGRAASILNAMCNSHISLRVPQLTVMASGEIRASLAPDHSTLTSVHIEFQGPFNGVAALVFPAHDATHLVHVLTDEEDAAIEDPEEFAELREGTLIEIGNIVINGVIGAMNNILGEHMNFRVPEFREGPISCVLAAPRQGFEVLAMVAHTSFCIDNHDLEGKLLMIYDVESFDNLLSSLRYGEHV